MKKLVFITIILTLIGATFIFWQGASFYFSSANPHGQSQIFEVKPGSSLTRVATQLEEKSIISSAWKFKILAKVLGASESVRVGEYLISSSMTPEKVLEVITSGKSILHTVTIPEGYNMFEVAELLENAGLGSKDLYLSLFTNQSLIKKWLGESSDSFEGYLFPETYSYTKYTTPEQLLESMVDRFLEVWKTLDSQPHSTLLSRHQVVTLASVVEKETGAPEERPVIASVFHNRLQKKMRLQSDPTILYGILVETGDMKKNIQKKDIARATPYNTYVVRALPKGPIANPGKEALRAVLQPKPTEFLYFVSRNDGTHVFSKTYEEHNKAVHAFQLNHKARTGKSWRDLKDRKSTKRSDL